MFHRFVLCVATVSVFPMPAGAQRRGEESSSGKRLLVELPKAVRFGEALVAARSFRVSITGRGLSLADASSMVLVANLPAVETPAEGWTVPPTVKVVEAGKQLSIVVVTGDRALTVTGEIVELTPKRTTEVELAGKRETQLGRIGPAEKTERELIAQALERFGRDVTRCADKAQRNRWRTDDRRFTSCVCPLAGRWRLPKVKANLRYHHFLAKKRSGMSFTVTPEGRASDCRVWVGTSPPDDEVEQAIIARLKRAAESDVKTETADASPVAPPSKGKVGEAP